MGKESERFRAKEYFFEGKNQKEIAKLVKVQEKTIGVWIKKYAWRQERDAVLNSSKNRIQDLKRLIGKLTSQHLELLKEIEVAEANKDLEKSEELQARANGISSKVANYNKTIITLEKENKIPLSVYIEVMQDVFKELQNYDSNLYMKLLDFQEEHLTEISLKLG